MPFRFFEADQLMAICVTIYVKPRLEWQSVGFRRVSAFIIQFLSLPSRIPLSDPGHTDTGFMDKTKPHDPFLKDGAKRKMRSFCSRPSTALFTKSDLFVAIILFKTVHYWTAIPPE
jgi:hypothetical protein